MARFSSYTRNSKDGRVVWGILQAEGAYHVCECAPTKSGGTIRVVEEFPYEPSNGRDLIAAYDMAVGDVKSRVQVYNEHGLVAGDLPSSLPDLVEYAAGAEELFPLDELEAHAASLREVTE